MRACQQCHYYSGDPLLPCSLHPAGMDAASCPDFSQVERTAYEQQFSTPVLNPASDNHEENWVPTGAAYYGGELVLQPQRQMTESEQLDALDWHPLFTGRCPQCEQTLLTESVNVSCDCGWNCGKK